MGGGGDLEGQGGGSCGKTGKRESRELFSIGRYRESQQSPVNKIIPTKDQMTMP